MGVIRLLPYLQQQGGAAQWKRKALQQPEIQNLTADRREAAIKKWVLDNQDETEEWIVELEDEPKVAQWINKRRDLHALAPVGKIAIDSGQWYSALERIRKQLEHRLHTDTPKEVRQQFEYARLRMINMSLKLKARSFGPDVHFIVAFDHPHARPEAKKETLERRLRSQVVTSLDLETKSEARLSAAKNKKLRRSRRVARKSKSEGEGEVADKGKGKSTSEAEGKGDGEEQMEEAPVQISISDADRETAFPPFDPFDSEAIRKLRESGDEWDCRIADEAEQLLLLADQVVAKTEADYIIPVLVDSTTTRQQHEAVVDKIVRRSVPSSGEVHDDASKVIVSMDSDSIVSTDRTVADFIVLPLRSKQIRVVDVESLYSAMGWTDRWHAAGLAAFVGNDFTGGGITGVGYKSLAEKGELDRIAKSSKTWCQARRDLQTSGTTQELIDGQKFTSIDALSRHFDSIVSRHSQNSSNTRPRLTFNAWSSSVTIQAGWRPSGAIVDKREVLSKLKRGLHDQVEEAKIALASRQSDAMQIDDSTSPPSRRPRDRGHRVLFRRRQQALTFDDRITNVVDCPRPIKGQLGFRMKSQANGPEYFRLLREEAARLKAPAAAQDDNNGPPRKRRRTQAPTNVTLNNVEPQPSPCQPEAPKDGKTQPESTDRGEESQNDEAGENEDGEPEETKKKPKVKRFPNLLQAKQCIVRRPACERVLRNLIVDGDTTFRKSFANLLHWIRQIEVAEMPLKVGLINRVISLYARFAPQHLVQVLDGGNRMTNWAAAILTLREWFDVNRDSGVLEEADDATTPSAVPRTMSGAAKDGLQNDLALYVQGCHLTRAEVKLCNDTSGNVTLDFFCRLAIVLDGREGLDLSATADSGTRGAAAVFNTTEFNQRNMSPFGTAIANSTRSDAKRFDWILAKLIVEFPSYFRVDASSLPFGNDNAEILAALNALSSDEGVVLANLSKCPPVKRLVREAIATLPIAGDADPARLSRKIAKLVSDLRLLLLDWQLPPTLTIGSASFATAVDKIGIYIGSAVRWVEADLRAWVKERERGATAATLGEWIFAATGAKDQKSQKGQPAWKQDQKGKDALKDLMVVVAGHAQLRQRTFRFAPTTIWLNAETLYSMLAENFRLDDKIIFAMRRIAEDLINFNSDLAEEDLDIKKFPKRLKRETASSKDVKDFEPKRVASETLRRLGKRDSTLKRQLGHLDKLVSAELHEWRGVDFKEAAHDGPFLVLMPTDAVENVVSVTVSKVRRGFKSLGLNKVDFVHGCAIVMDHLFKPTYGQLLLNGDIGVSATEWHLGAIDHRQRLRSKVQGISGKCRHYETCTNATAGGDELRSGVAQGRRKDEQVSTHGGVKTKELVLSRFQLSNDGKIEFRPSSAHVPPTSGSTTTGMTREPPLDKPVEVYECVPPHLYVNGVPEKAKGLDRAKRAFDFASTFFAEAETAGVRSTAASSSSAVHRQHVLVAHDPGQVEAIATSFLDLTGSGSSRAFVRQRQFKSSEGHETKVIAELTRFSVDTRLGDALQASRKSVSDESLEASTSLPSLVDDRPSLPASSSTAQPIATLSAPTLAHSKDSIVRLKPSKEVLAVKSPILRQVFLSQGSHLSKLRSKETAALGKKRDQSRASAMVRTAIRKPTAWSLRRTSANRTRVLHVLPSGPLKVNKGFGRDRSKALVTAFDQALGSTPWLDVSTVSCGEYWTSSVCQDPRCRAT
ncbi:uncharacterized protein JCM15063_000245 [Sporobolomyces koalae]|uniref:uncharacterized protein n=1 Tax=Sporobolomyces koalae TaxID=500713 RepID=UPI0031707060